MLGGAFKSSPKNSKTHSKIIQDPKSTDLGARVDDGEIRVEFGDLRGGLGPDEHVGDEVLLPGQLVHETDFLLGRERGAAEAVEDVGLLEGVEVVDGLRVVLCVEVRLCPSEQRMNEWRGTLSK